MAVIKRQAAVDRLVAAIETSAPDDVVEMHNELFPEQPSSLEVADLVAIRSKIQDHIDSGLEAEEITDLWNVVFPGHRRVWFDDDAQQLHYHGKAAPIAPAA